MTRKNSGAGGSFVSSSPRPSTMAVPPITQNGTSEPTCAPSSHSAGMDSGASYARLSARRTAAASALPPPRPACIGMRLLMKISSPSLGRPVRA